MSGGVRLHLSESSQELVNNDVIVGKCSWLKYESMLSSCNLCLKLRDVCRPGQEDWHLLSEYKGKYYLPLVSQKSHSHYFSNSPFLPSYGIQFAFVYIVITCWTPSWCSEKKRVMVHSVLNFIIIPDKCGKSVHIFVARWMTPLVRVRLIGILMW